MRVKDQDLLLKDLCGRLPYGVKCIANSDGYAGVISSIESLYGVATFDDGRQEEICDIKPYLFPRSSMTDKQHKEWYNTLSSDENITYDTVDWLNKNHFDYRCLIQKGFAIDATGLNIYKEK